MTRSQAFNILRRVRGELDAGRFALTEALRATNDDVNFLQAAYRSGVTEIELRRCADNLEITFTPRLFSEFEAILRDYWTAAVRPTSPDMRPLMDSIAARRRISENHLAAAHAIRDFRNDIIHEKFARSSIYIFRLRAIAGKISQLAPRWLVIWKLSLNAHRRKWSR
jgi:hypothetical protein